ncbi:MAG: alkaline phosphatase family protein [Pirellulaceae bacterium]|nr:alkaline phosphatase family protein [Pirellulaceae bacterium]
MPNRLLAFAPLYVLCLVPQALRGEEPAAKPQFPGPTSDGFLLPNGWRLTPVGRQVPLTDLPLNIVVSPDDKTAFVATSGYNAHELTAVELATGRKIDTQTAPQSWFGLATDPKSGRFWWSGGGDALIHAFTWNGTKFAKRPSEPQPPQSQPGDKESASPPGFRTGICWDAKADSLYSLTILPKGGNKSFAWGDATTDKNAGGVISRITVEAAETGDLTAPCGTRPYDVILGKNGLLYVSDWADRAVLVVDPQTLRTISRIVVGEHPNQLALHPQDDRLFVACASSNTVHVIDTVRGTVQETIFTALFPQSPEGSTPDALCISPDGELLFVANADNNCIAVIDIEAPRRSQVRGFIPTGWYPTAVAITSDGKQLLVGLGKGNETQSNKPAPDKLAPALEKPAEVGGYKRIPFPHVGTTLSGALSIVDLPGEKDDRAWAALTDRVYRNCPYSDKLLTVAPTTRKTAIPTKVGDPSPIKHVLYIIKENRTYDQVFSDIERGNRDPSLLMFGREITPNHHKLAEEYVLLDNLYCNGHVSADGHPWSTMAYNTDYIARNWALTYSKRQGIDDDDDGDLSNAPSGYIWDSCKRLGKTYRSYGEYGGRVSQPDGTFRMEGRVPGLIGHVCPTYGLPTKPGQKVRDTDRVETFLAEFREYEKNGNLPHFIVMSLGEDHTEGTKPGSPTPQACVASNDLALGKLVEAVSQSKYWPKIAIFVIEDDAQNGPDHVDAHRTIGLVISPYVRRKYLDSTQYSTVSMLRTMELILGLPPLSQFDAAANPMFESFTSEPDLATYQHEPARIDLNALNQATAYGAERSSKMDFSEYDKIDDFELNEILWRAIHGKNAPLPPAVRRAIAYRNIEPTK